MAWTRAIFGCSGLRVTKEERAFYRDVRPWGFILFGRNVGSASQLQALTTELREVIDDSEALVFVDQEGGRVQRLRPPLARQRKPAQAFGLLHQKDPEAGREAAFLNHRLIAHELRAYGFDADCAPSLDVSQVETHVAIGDRAYAASASTVAELGRAAMEGLIAGGVAPVVKHMPGHGRARVDSHLSLPAATADLDALDETDFAPFRALADASMGMTGHVVFTQIDPHAPATQSSAVIQEVIRDAIGFDGLLMTDDLSMKALKGSYADRTRAALDAGCDLILHCNGDMAEMKGVASALTELDGKCLERADAARACARDVQPFDADAAEARLAEWGLQGSTA